MKQQQEFNSLKSNKKTLSLHCDELFNGSTPSYYLSWSINTSYVHMAFLVHQTPGEKVILVPHCLVG